MNIGEVGLLAGAGFLAGAVNSVAGGGSLISFPALLGAGYPAVPANVTNSVALWPGYVGGALGYAGMLRERAREFVPLAVTSLIGAVLGAVLLLTTSASVFKSLVPYLILASCVLLVLQPRIARWLRSRGEPGADQVAHPAVLHGCVLAASCYGSYFGAGLGVMLLAVLGVLLHEGLNEVNGIKNALSLLINTVALIAFALFGPVQWPAVLVMATTSLLGGYAGALVAKRIDPRVLRGSVFVFGVVVAGSMLARS
ncbi:MAG: sulfite exporter TauE/SafE family protein [Motilibacteraceae bacterium]